MKNDAREYDLQVNGATDAFRVYDVTATTERLTITSSGNVGINSTAPGGKLDVAGQSNFSNNGVHVTQLGVALAVRHGSNTNMRGNHLIVDDQPSGSGTYFIQATESTVSNERNLVLQGYGGNVGVGSTIPEAKLSVTGIGTFKDDVYIDKKLYVSGIEIGGPGGPGIGTDITTRHLKVTGITTFVSGNVDVNSDVDINRSLSVTGGVSVTGISSFVSFLDVNDTTQSSDKDTGSIITEGGVGIEKNLNVGGVINSSTDVRINGTSVVDTALNDAVAMAIALG